MKHLKTYFSGLFALLTVCTACSTDGEFDPLEIRMSSGIGTITAGTRGLGIITNELPVNRLPVSFVRVDKHAQGADLNYPANYTGISYLPAEIDKAINRIEFTQKQYYLPDGGTTRFIGWYPEATSTTASETSRVRWNATAATVTFPAIDGSTDILLAQPIEGKKANPFNDDTHKVRFTHVLTQVRVFIKSGHTDYIPYWGQITAIEFVGKQQPCVLTLPNPRGVTAADTVATSFPATGATDLKMCAKGSTAAHGTLTLTTTETEVGYAMFAPHKTENAATANIQIKITTTIGGVHTIELDYANDGVKLLAGEVYLLKLSFDAREIVPTAIIDSWTNAANQPEEITVI